MGCNMCVVQRPEEQCRVMFQVHGKDACRMPQDVSAEGLHSGRGALVQRKGPRKKNGAAGVPALISAAASCVDSSTQTDITFQNVLPLGRTGHPLQPILEPCELNELVPLEHEYYAANDYYDISQHEVDRQDELEYEEVKLYKSCQEDKLGLTVCYRTDDEEDLGIYVGEVNPNSIAAKDGRIREGDRILQINGVDVQNREEAVAILTQEDSTNISLLLARPDIENNHQLDPRELELELQLQAAMRAQALDNTTHLCSPQRLRKESPLAGAGRGAVGTERRGWSSHRDASSLRHTALSNSQELDSGVGRTDESTRNEESSEHDLLGDEQTSASNTPGSTRKFRVGHGDTPPPLHTREFHFSTDSLPGLECAAIFGGTHAAMPGLTDEERERYRELLEIRRFYSGAPADGSHGDGLAPREMALLEEELRHLEFKCRNVLRAQKMQQLRERCMRAWPAEEEACSSGLGGSLANNGSLHHELSDINELPERERSDKESTSAYNTGGESCRSTPLAGEQPPPASTDETLTSRTLDRNRESGQSRASNKSYVGEIGNTSPVTKFRSLSQDAREGSRGAEKGKPGGANTADMSTGHIGVTSPYFTRRHRGTRLPERYHSCGQLRGPSDGQDPKEHVGEGKVKCEAGDGEGTSGPSSSWKDSLISSGDPVPDYNQPPLPLPLGPAVPPGSPRMEWKIKVRSDGSRYVAKRPVRDRLLKARAMKIREERSGTTTDDDAVSEMKMGRYWSKEERKQQLMRAREYRRRREFMMQSRLDFLREREQLGITAATAVDGCGVQQAGLQDASILELSQRRSAKKRSRKILDNWITIQELLAHGTRSPDGKKVYNPLLSVTTV